VDACALVPSFSSRVGWRSHSETYVDAMTIRQHCAEDVPGLSREEIPRDLQVAGGITHTQTPEVDDGAEPTPLDQQVKR
jgi:hypothetical protein